MSQISKTSDVIDLTSSKPRLELVNVGDNAPDATLTTTEGKEVQLASLWTEKPVSLVFLRHLGCTFCREQIALLRQDYKEFSNLGAEVVCIAQGDYKTGKAFSILFDLPFPMLMCGDDLSVYKSYGLHRGTMGQLFGIKSLVRGVATILGGYGQGKIVGDGMQMPGVFVIDTGGIIRWVHRHANASDNPKNKDIIAAVKDIVK